MKKTSRGSNTSLQSNMRQGKAPRGKSDPGDLRETMHQGDRPDRKIVAGKLGSIMHQ